MADQLSYTIITPTALHKGRTGGILARLISRSGLDLITGRIFAPSCASIFCLYGVYMTVKNYKFKRANAEWVVTVDGKRLPRKQPSGEQGEFFSDFDSGKYAEDQAAPQYLAFSILQDFNPEVALDLHAHLHETIISRKRDETWMITSKFLEDMVRFRDGLKRIPSDGILSMPWPISPQ